MSLFIIKRRDTWPILEAALKNPDGSAFDLTGAGVEVNMHVLQVNGALFTRAMTIYGAPTNGAVRYTFLAADWDTLTATKGTAYHQMEIEALNGTVRCTFPNDSYDSLKVVDDLGQHV